MIIGVAYSLVLAGFGLSVLLTKLHGLDIQAMESAGATWTEVRQTKPCAKLSPANHPASCLIAMLHSRLPFLDSRLFP